MAISPIGGFDVRVTRNVTQHTGTAAVNLSVGNRRATMLDIESSAGHDATLPPATVALAGLMTAAFLRQLNDNKAKLDTIQRGASPNEPIGDIKDQLFMLPDVNNFNDNDRSRLDQLTDSYIRGLFPAVPSIAGLLNRMQVLAILQAAAGTGLSWNAQSNTLNVSGTGGASTHATHYHIAGVSQDSTFIASELTVTSQNANIVLPAYSGDQYVAVGVEDSSDNIVDIEIGGFSVFSAFERVPGTILVSGRSYKLWRTDQAGDLSAETLRVVQ